MILVEDPRDARGDRVHGRAVALDVHRAHEHVLKLVVAKLGLPESEVLAAAILAITCRRSRRPKVTRRFAGRVARSAWCVPGGLSS